MRVFVEALFKVGGEAYIMPRMLVRPSKPSPFFLGMFVNPNLITPCSKYNAP